MDPVVVGRCTWIVDLIMVRVSVCVCIGEGKGKITTVHVVWQRRSPTTNE